MNLTWKDVYNSQKSWPADYDQCRDIAKGCRYQYLAFNGRVFDIDDKDMKNPICNDVEL